MRARKISWEEQARVRGWGKACLSTSSCNITYHSTWVWLDDQYCTNRGSNTRYNDRYCTVSMLQCNYDSEPCMWFRRRFRCNNPQIYRWSQTLQQWWSHPLQLSRSPLSIIPSPPSPSSEPLDMVRIAAVLNAHKDKVLKNFYVKMGLPPPWHVWECIHAL